MNGNAELLNYVYQNARMGVETIGQLLDIVSRSEFKRHLEYQYKHYQEMNAKARQMLEEKGYDEKSVGAMTRITAHLGVNLQTLGDRSASHIAEMMIKDIIMGVIDALRNIRRYHDAENDILGLMKDLLRFEEDNIEALKSFV